MPRARTVFRTVLQPIAIAVVLAVIARAAVHVYSIPSRSMAPALEPGDQILVTRYFRALPERGHVIVFRSPSGGDELMVKRVVGVPGDLIDSRLGRVRIGGHTLPEPYVMRVASAGSIEAMVVPQDSYYVLGDNRDDSLDSRSWGIVRHDQVIGRAQMVLWSSTFYRQPVAAQPAHPSAPVHVERARLFKWID